MRQKVFGIHGKARSGKDTFARYLSTTGEGLSCVYSFATPIYEMLRVLLGSLPVYEDENQQLQYDKNSVFVPYDKTLRYMLQTLGTEWGRNIIDPSIWVHSAASYVEKQIDDPKIEPMLDSFIFPDIRFPNEAEFVRSLGGTVIHLVREERDSIDNPKHSSEDVLSNTHVDCVIRNYGSLNDLQAEANRIFTTT